MPYENALSAYAGNCFFVAADGESGSTEPFADSSPTQSWAPTMTSGAVSTATVVSWERMSPKFFWTTCTDAPLDAAQAFATCVTAATRSASAQITTLALWLLADVPAETATVPMTATARVRPSARSVRRLGMDFLLGILGAVERAT